LDGPVTNDSNEYFVLRLLGRSRCADVSPAAAGLAWGSGPGVGSGVGGVPMASAANDDRSTSNSLLLMAGSGSLTRSSRPRLGCPASEIAESTSSR
jgi:hypothetical protein